MSLPVNNKLTERFDYHFHISESGVYAISVAARCRSETQIQKSGGEDLRVEIDGIAFREIPALLKPQYQDIPVSWNGTRLKGLKQTVVFVLHLDAGEHAITFIPQTDAVIENEPRIKLMEDFTSIEFDPEERAEDGDRRPWFTFAFIDLPLRSFSLDASVGLHWRDREDIKLILDGATQQLPDIAALQGT